MTVGAIFGTFLFAALPAAIASVPAMLAFSQRRKILGWLLFVGALIATIPLPILADREDVRREVAAGHVADSLGFIFYPWVFGVEYAIGAALVLVFALFALRKSQQV